MTQIREKERQKLLNRNKSSQFVKNKRSDIFKLFWGENGKTLFILHYVPAGESIPLGKGLIFSRIFFLLEFSNSPRRPTDCPATRCNLAARLSLIYCSASILCARSCGSSPLENICNGNNPTTGSGSGF